MSNTIKYSEGSESLALNKGNWWIGTGDTNKGPSDVTGYYAGVTPPSSGYTIYTKREDNLPSIFVAQNDQELIFLTNQISELNFTTTQECLNYFQSQDDKLCVNREYENIVTDGLVLNLDAGYAPSYPTSGTTWYDLSGNGNNGTLINGPTFSGDSLVFDGTDDRLNLSSTVSFSNTDMTSSYWFKLPGPINLLNRRVLFNGPLGWFEFSSQSTILFRMRIDGSIGHKNLGFSPGITLDQVHNIVLTKTNNDFRVYNNGSIAATYTAPYLVYHPSVGSDSYPLDSTTSLEFNYSQFSGVVGRRFNGNLYNASIYNRALTPQEVLQNYNAQKSRFGL